ncbi:formylglycine-generating enzyme family protein [Holophaga foetida]|uniref:formylglycine-generating enzyme family protein n=1 Tax=Holophaga foetida TaxID=35839 RepID=UPI0002473329|nr:formylglycine-generating enzyme family protein [Holophaga foetida]
MKSLKRASALPLLGVSIVAFGADLSIPIPGASALVLKAIPAGSFTMGSEGTAQPPHRVTLTQAFHMAQCEVTQGQWQALMSGNPSQFAGDPQRPVEHVSWEDTQAFIKALNQNTATARPADLAFRLPTEAEWEYACRASSTTAFSFGDSPNLMGSAGWYEVNASYTTQPTGRKQANAWGLQDMHGNVSEWCQDWFGPYADAAQTDPAGPASGAFRIVRGGSWAQSGEACSSASRSLLTPATATDRTGFRVVLAAK